MKIAISGIGGLGGYFGGLLSHAYEYGDTHSVIFLARGENETAIRSNGLRVDSVKENFITHPALVTSTPAEAGIIDLLICCTKRYDLESNLRECDPCIDDHTIILPLLNGVDTREFILKLYPNNLVLDGCAYLVARLSAPGVVTETGNISKIFFGLENNSNPVLNEIHTILINGGVEAYQADDIQNIIWEKFSFISPIATLTSYLNCSIGEILADEYKSELLHALFEELKSVAERKHVILKATTYQEMIERMARLPFSSTSSMHSDFQNGKRTELDSLTGYIVNAAGTFGLRVPVYQKMYAALLHK